MVSDLSQNGMPLVILVISGGKKKPAQEKGQALGAKDTGVILTRYRK